MTETEVEKVVLDTLRKYTRDEAVSLEARFAEDLRLSDAARQMLFAQLAQAFDARGVSLPGHGFWQRDFLGCTTPAAAQAAIRAKIFARGGASRKASPAPGAAAKKADAPKAEAKPAAAHTATAHTAPAAAVTADAPPASLPASEAMPDTTAMEAQPAEAKPTKRARAPKKAAKKKPATKSRAKARPLGDSVEQDWGV
jgi:hypothetical protein